MLDRVASRLIKTLVISIQVEDTLKRIKGAKDSSNLFLLENQSMLRLVRPRYISNVINLFRQSSHNNWNQAISSAEDLVHPKGGTVINPREFVGKGFGFAV